MRPPIFDKLIKHVSRQRVKFCTPGHKGKIRMRTDNLCRIDIENIPRSDDEGGISDAIIQSQNEIAGIFAASKSYYLTNGTTAGIYAALASVCTPGDKVIVDPECDKAVINAITILALQPVFLCRSYCSKYGFNGGISTEKIEASISACPDAKIIIVTSPSYYGVCANIKKLANCAHENNMLLMVDESFGAHFTFAKALPESALECGADIVVHSVSKTLGGFNGTALLHLAETITPPMQASIEANLDIYQGGNVSTSMLCAIENIIFYAFENSGKYNAVLKEIDRGKELILSKTDILWFDAEYANGCNISVVDKTKIVLNFSNIDILATDVYGVLSAKYGIEADYADEHNIVFSVTMYNTPSEIRKLINSCLAICKLTTPTADVVEDSDEYTAELYDEGPKAVMSPYKAFYGSSEFVNIADSLGKICKKVIAKLPHGTPIIIPGEKINQDQIDAVQALIAQGVRLYGLDNSGKIEVLTLSDSFYF